MRRRSRFGRSATRPAGAGVRGQISTSIARPRDGHDQTLDDVLQLADVARPRILRQRLHRIRRDAGDGRAVLRRKLRQEQVDQQRNVLAALAQLQDNDVDDVEAVEEVLAKRALLPPYRADRGWSRQSRGRSDARSSAPTFWISPVSRKRSRSPASAASSPLLRREGGAEVRGLELARLVAIRPGEAAFDVNSSDSSSVSGSPAQLTGANILGARPARMDGARGDFLTRSALSGNEHFRVGPCDAIDFFLEGDHCRCVHELDVRLRRIAEIGLTRAVSSTNMSFVLGSVRLKGGHYVSHPAKTGLHWSSRHESLDQLPQVGTQPHERRTGRYPGAPEESGATR